MVVFILLKYQLERNLG